MSGRQDPAGGIQMRKPKHTELTKVGMPEAEAKSQLLWTVSWTFAFLLMSIIFLQGA